MSTALARRLAALEAIKTAPPPDMPPELMRDLDAALNAHDEAQAAAVLEAIAPHGLTLDQINQIDRALEGAGREH